MPSSSTAMEKAEKTPIDSDCTPPWLDRDFVARVLKSDDATIDASSVELISVRKVGGGFLSETLRVVARAAGGSGGSRETSLFVKAAPKATGAVRAVEELGVYRKEEVTYGHLLPSLHAALQEAEGREFEPLAPKLYLQGRDPVSFTVLEDLAQAGFRPWPLGVNLDLRACTAALRAVARLHAASVAVLGHQPYCEKLFQQSLIFNESVLDRLDADEAAFKEDLRVLEENPWFRRYGYKLRACARGLLQTPILRVKHCAVQFKVILHGDLHKNNMMFRDGEGEGGLKVRLYDFQGLHVGSPSEDLQYFLHTSASLEVLKHHRELLVSEYHSSLQRTLRALGLHSQADAYPLEQLLADMDHFGSVAVLTAFKLLPFMLRTDDMRPPPDTQSENFRQQIDEFRQAFYREEKFLRYLQYLVPVFDSKGYFESERNTT